MSDPQTLDQLSETLQDYLTREVANRQEWIEIQMGICLTLVEMRDTFPADTEFGKWFDARFGSIINDNTRIVAITMGRQPNALRACLTVTERISLRHIYRNEFARYCHMADPSNPDHTDNHDHKAPPMSRQEKAANQHAMVMEWFKQRGDEGATSGEAEKEFGITHQSMSRIIVAAKNDGEVVPTGKKSETPSGGKGELLVHRDFATAKMVQSAKKNKKPGKSGNKRRRVVGTSVPLNRFVRDIIVNEAAKTMTHEEKYGFSEAEANEIDPETGKTKAMTHLQKFGHAPTMPHKQRVLLEQRKEAVRLAPQLRDLKKVLNSVNPALKLFLRTPQEQSDDIVPMPPIDFIQAVLEVDDGPRIRERVEEALQNLEQELAAFTAYCDTINTYIAALKAALKLPPSIDGDTMTESEGATKH